MWWNEWTTQIRDQDSWRGFDLNHDEIEIVREKFPDLQIKNLKIFRTNKYPEIQYDFGDIKISKEEDKNLEYWQTSTKQLSNFVESIPNYISKKLDTDFFTGNISGTVNYYENLGSEINEAPVFEFISEIITVQ